MVATAMSSWHREGDGNHSDQGSGVYPTVANFTLEQRGVNPNASNASANGLSDYEYTFTDFDLWEYYLKPSAVEWFVICLYLVVFLVSIVGNVLVVAYILRRKHMQTTINYFMLNLALADLLVTLICLPPTLLVDFLESWLMGKLLCKLTPFLQMTVTLVSSLTLGAIAVNRWFVVCHPLRCGTFHKSTRAAGMTMVAIWFFSLSTLCPVAFFNQLTPDFAGYDELAMLQSCGEHWPSPVYQAAFHTYFVLIAYTLPLFILGITYTRVFKALSRKEIPGFSMAGKSIRSSCKCASIERRTSDGRSIRRQFSNITTVEESTQKLKRASPQRKSLQKDASAFVKTRKTSTLTRRIRKRLTMSSAEKYVCRKCAAKISLIQMRKKSARMQVALIVVFGLCYAPVMILNLLRRCFGSFWSMNRGTTYFIFAIAHLLMYFNSALNPIIYNFFSAQFRREFRSTFCCNAASRRDLRAGSSQRYTTVNFTRSVSLASATSPVRRKHF